MHAQAKVKAKAKAKVKVKAKVKAKAKAKVCHPITSLKPHHPGLKANTGQGSVRQERAF
jgi:hypothetical protein